jgi:DsbC/DsbD-like thiol-disulfide interchange protein
MVLHMPRLRLTVAAVLLLAFWLGPGTGAARAADDASPWDGDARSAARLIAASPPGKRAEPLRGGVEIRLKPGWHTYWRYPGDAGVPPRFDLGQSQNIKAVEVLWPAPQRLPEDGLVTIGYDRDVTLPLRVTPLDAGKPVALRLKLEYAICERLCVPAEAKLELPLAGRPSTQDAALAAAEARVPRKRTLAQERGDNARDAGQPDGGLAIRSIRREAGGEHGRVVIDVARPRGTSVALFAEGPTPQWALPVPAAVDGAPDGVQRFELELDGAPPDASYTGATVTLTAVTDRDAIEVPFRLE